MGKRIKNKSCEFCKKPSYSKFCCHKCSADFKHFSTINNIKIQLLSGLNFKCTNPSLLKKTLIELKGHTCSICNGNVWMGNPIPLVMDHIDGRALNNTLVNLRLVCGNCDMLLPTYKSKNKNSDRSKKISE